MRRRHYLGILGASSLSAIAGCSSGASEPTDTTQPTTRNTTTSSPAEFEVTDITPENVEYGESAQIEVEVRNVGGSEGTWDSEVSTAVTAGGSEPDPGDFNTNTFEIEIPAGESRVWTTRPFSDSPKVVYYRIGEDGEVKTLEVPDSKAPIITDTTLVSEWQSFGDVIENRIDEIEAGSFVNIASRYWYWAENSTYETFKQVEVYDSNDERVAIQTEEAEQVVEQSGWREWESYLPLDSSGWGTGTYTARMLIRDNQTNEVSNTGTVEFELI